MKIYQVNDGNNFNGISVTQVAIKPVRSQKSKVVSFADITFNNVFVVKDLKVVNGSKGPFVSFPQKSYDKNGKKEYYDTAHPITGDLRKYIQGIVLTYNNQTTPQQPQQQNFQQPQNQQQQNQINSYNRQQQQQNFNQQPQQGFNQQQQQQPQQNFNQQPQQQNFGQQPQQQNFNQQPQQQPQQNPFMNNVPNNKINSVLMGGN